MVSQGSSLSRTALIDWPVPLQPKPRRFLVGVCALGGGGDSSVFSAGESGSLLGLRSAQLPSAE